MVEGGVDGLAVSPDAAGQLDEHRDAAAARPGDPPVQGLLAFLAFDRKHMPQALFEQIGAIQAGIGFGDPGQLGGLAFGEVLGVLPQRIPGALEPPGPLMAGPGAVFLPGQRPRVIPGPAPLTVSTARQYQNSLRMFCDFICDGRYGWQAKCQNEFGQAPMQILHEHNSVAHVTEFEGQPGRRPLSYDEVQALFDAADGRVEDIRSRGRKGALTAMRDSALLKAFYAFGLRRQEACGLDVTDLRHNPNAPQYRRYGGVFVRGGKSSKGSPPKRRTVFTVPEMDWIVEVLDHYLTESGHGSTPATIRPCG
jgi:hypothetical protein